MAMIAIPIHKEISRLFQAIDVDANRDLSDHITMIYLDDNLGINKVIKIIPAIFDITSNTKPFEVSTSKITCFPEGKHGFPIIAMIESKELNKLRSDITKAFNEKKISFNEKFPDYKPHITLGYAKEKVKDIKFDKLKITISEISLYGGDTTDDKLFVNFPFSLKTSKLAQRSNTFLKFSYQM
jgi:2'-5' RNA ligase